MSSMGSWDIPWHLGILVVLSDKLKTFGLPNTPLNIFFLNEETNYNHKTNKKDKYSFPQSF